jgi:hypothetical protein
MRPFWIETIRVNDFLLCAALRTVIVDRDSRLREIHGFWDCSLLESIEIRARVEIIGPEAFTHLVVGFLLKDTTIVARIHCYSG